MAQTYTLEEAAQRLGVSPEDFKRRLKDDFKSLRSFRDGATLRFRTADIDELARTLGEQSDPGLQLGPTGLVGSSDDYLLPPDQGDSSEEDIFSVAAGDSGKRKKPGDSDIRLELDSGPKRKDDDSHTGLTEEIALDLDAAGKSGVLRSGGSSSKMKKTGKSGPNLSGPKSTKIPGPPGSADISGPESSSEFELSLDSDSDSFEMQLNRDGSEEVDLGGPTRSGQSGINLGKPKDSGVSLESKRPVDDGDSDDFELSLDPDSDPAVPMPKASRPSTSRNDSDSEFELTLDDSSGSMDSLQSLATGDDSGRDIFETDFNLQSSSEDAESGSEVVEVGTSDTDLENSDFDLALDESDVPEAGDESASQVVLMDETDESGVGVGAAAGAAALAGAGAAALGRKGGRKKPKVDEDEVSMDDEDDSESASGAMRRLPKRDLDDDDAAPAGTFRAAPWGTLPVAVLVPCLLLTFLGSLMSYELLKGMWGYHNGRTTTGGLAGSVAGAFGMEVGSTK